MILIVSILLLSLIVAVHQATRALRPEILKVLVILAALLKEGLPKKTFESVIAIIPPEEGGGGFASLITTS